MPVTTCTTQSAIAVTMPVPFSTPTSTPAASTIETTPTMLGACATISSAWLRSFGKLITSARRRADHEDVRQRHDIQHEQHHDRERQREVDPDQLGPQRRPIRAQHRVGHHGVEVFGFEHLLLGEGRLARGIRCPGAR